MLRDVTKRLTVQGNEDCMEVFRRLQKIYKEYRDKGYSMEEVHWMICSGANQCVLTEVLAIE